MAIQDLINEVNSIQTKKQAIKEAITAKGVTSEGKLSKFADEIKQISTGEPDWYMINRIRHDNGNEGIYVRTNVSGMNRITATQLTKNWSNFKESDDVLSISSIGDFYIVNGTFFPQKESICRVPQMTTEYTALNLNGNKDNFVFKYQFGVKESSVIFSDINSYSYLKQFRNNTMVDFNALYIKSDAVNVDTANSTVTFTNAKDIINPTTNTVDFTASINGGNIPVKAIVIDSTAFINASKNKPIEKAGFIRFNDDSNIMSRISLVPVDGAFHNVRFSSNAVGTGIYLITECYNSMPMGNYVYMLSIGGYTYVVFVGINYIVNQNRLKEKNIEIYPYHITIQNTQEEIPFSRYTNGKAAEIYLNFSQQGQWQLQSAPSLNIFRRLVLAANGTPEANTSKFLTGGDALLTINASKSTNDKIARFNTTTNEFKKYHPRLSLFKYSTTLFSSFETDTISSLLVDAITSNNKITGFIRLNDDSSTIFPIELEKAPDSVKNNPKISYYQNNASAASIAPNGIPEDGNKMILFTRDFNRNITCFYIKKGNDYITNDWLSTTAKKTTLYITSDAETQKYLTTKPLSDIWTEINSLNKDDFEAYSEQ